MNENENKAVSDATPKNDSGQKLPKKIEKKWVIIGIVCALVVVAGSAFLIFRGAGGGNASHKVPEGITNNPSYREDMSYVYVDADVEAMQKRVDKKETFALLMGSSSEYEMSELIPLINEAALANNFETVEYIDTTTTDIDTMNRITDLVIANVDENYRDKFMISTPSIVFFREGKVVYVYNGVLDGVNLSTRTLTQEERNELFKVFDSAFAYANGTAEDVYQINITSDNAGSDVSESSQPASETEVPEEVREGFSPNLSDPGAPAQEGTAEPAPEEIVQEYVDPAAAQNTEVPAAEQTW